MTERQFDMRLGSLFTGYGGLDHAVEQHYDARTVWASDIDPGACKIIAHRMPDAPNIGDITKVDWLQVEPVDILTGGFPCQDLSHAGKRAGMRPGTRSGLWSHMALAIEQLRPRYVVAENVRGLLSASADSDLESCPWCMGGSADGEPVLPALGAVLGDLAELGYDASWYGLRAADVGAPHGRFRIFVLAADTGGIGRWPGARLDEASRDGIADGVGRRSSHATDTSGESGRVGRGNDVRARRGEDGRRETTGGSAVADANNGRGNGSGLHRQGERWWSQPPSGGCDAAPNADGDGQQGIRRLKPVRRDTDRRCGADVAWGDYEPAIRRWERALGRPAPAPTETGFKGGQRLSPAFVEWMMGLPAGWVTHVPGLSRNAQLKALGNGVVPQQALAALRVLDGMEAAA